MRRLIIPRMLFDLVNAETVRKFGYLEVPFR